MSNNMRSIFILFISIVALVFILFMSNREQWPAPIGKKFQDNSHTQVKLFETGNHVFIDTSTKYESLGDYLEYSKKSKPKNGPRILLDEDGLPLVKYGDEWQYNPVTIGQFLLAEHGRYLSKPSEEGANFLVLIANKLIEMQRDDGAFPYGFKYRHYTETLEYKPGWVSGMAQGVVLSALARTYAITKNDKYLIAGNKALAFLNIDKKSNGPKTTLEDLDKSLKNYLFYMEYQTDPVVYTLNGYMFTLIGLYDWWQVTGNEQARINYKEGIKTLKKILPYYDIGNITAYDLGFMTHKRPQWIQERQPHMLARYHVVHINQLIALNSVEKSDLMSYYIDLWKSYVTAAKKDASL